MSTPEELSIDALLDHFEATDARAKLAANPSFIASTERYLAEVFPHVKPILQAGLAVGSTAAAGVNPILGLLVGAAGDAGLEIVGKLLASHATEAARQAEREDPAAKLVANPALEAKRASEALVPTLRPIAQALAEEALAQLESTPKTSTTAPPK